MTTWEKIPPPWLNKVWSSVWLISLKHRREETVFCAQVTITNACEDHYRFVLFLQSGFALKCQQCSSTTSMEDCKKNEKETDCGGNFDRCLKTSLDYKVLTVETKSFAKICATKALCNANQKLKEICKEAKGSTCESNCCDSDGCNSSAMPVISAFLLVLCTLVSKMCY